MVSTLNQVIVAELERAIGADDAVIVLGFHGVSVSDAEDLRDSIRETGARLHQVKNRLARVAFAERQIPIDSSCFLGMNLLLVGETEQTIQASKAIDALTKEMSGTITFKAAWFDGDALDAAGAQAIVSMPDRPTLQAMLCGALIGPGRQLATILREVPASLARVIQARVDGEEAA